MADTFLCTIRDKTANIREVAIIGRLGELLILLRVIGQKHNRNLFDSRFFQLMSDLIACVESHMQVYIYT